MKILNCPLNGPRNISEFVWVGEVKEMPAPAPTPRARDWADYVFIENNVAGVVREWWCHVLLFDLIDLMQIEESNSQKNQKHTTETGN